MYVYIGWCTNSVINLSRPNSTSHWNIPSLEIVADAAGRPSSKLNQTNISIYYSSTGSYSIGIGSLILPDYLLVYQPREIPSIQVTPIDNRGSSDIQITADFINSPMPGEEYLWMIVDNENAEEILPESNTYGLQFTYPDLGEKNDVTIRLRMNSSCCGVSYPLYQTLSPRTLFLALAPGSSTSGDTTIDLNRTTIILMIVGGSVLLVVDILLLALFLLRRRRRRRNVLKKSNQDARSTELEIISIPNNDKDKDRDRKDRGGYEHEVPGNAVWKEEEITDIDGGRKLAYFGVIFKGIDLFIYIVTMVSFFPFSTHPSILSSLY